MSFGGEPILRFAAVFARPATRKIFLSDVVIYQAPRWTAIFQGLAESAESDDEFFFLPVPSLRLF